MLTFLRSWRFPNSGVGVLQWVRIGGVITLREVLVGVGFSPQSPRGPSPLFRGLWLDMLCCESTQHTIPRKGGGGKRQQSQQRQPSKTQSQEGGKKKTHNPKKHGTSSQKPTFPKAQAVFLADCPFFWGACRPHLVTQLASPEVRHNQHSDAGVDQYSTERTWGPQFLFSHGVICPPIVAEISGAQS